jgi:hypothetical protein
VWTTDGRGESEGAERSWRSVLAVGPCGHTAQQSILAVLQRRDNTKKRITVEARGAENEQDGDDVALSGLQDMVRGHTSGPGSLGAELFHIQVHIQVHICVHVHKDMDIKTYIYRYIYINSRNI